MAQIRNYLHDRLALGLSSLNLAIVIITIVMLVIKLDLSSSQDFVTSYRANLGIEAFHSGGASAIVSLGVFSVVVFVGDILLSWKVFRLRRGLAIGILVAGVFLLLLSLIISNALLALH